MTEDQTKRINELEAQIKNMHAQREGWLVTTPNPAYDGVVYGIKFENGQAFIRKGQSVPHFEFEPLKDTVAKKMGYSPEEMAAIREREKVPSSDRCAAALQSEFGYLVEWFSGEDLEVLQKKQSDRLIQRQQMEVLQEQLADKVTAPHYLTK